ncbi:MAG: RidA family protein [Chloroflexota bacterium]|nr:RidA family protein [Chloroflexota bacterium]
MALERFNPEGMPPPISPYVNVVRARGMLVFVSGQVAMDERGQVVGVGDVEAQARLALEHVGRGLRAAGAEPSHVTKVTIYVRNMEDRVKIVPIRARFFGETLPASTIVEVSKLAHPDLLIEIEAVAVIPE